MFDKYFFIKFIKFCAVGLSGMIIDFGITWIIKEKLRGNKYVANSTGFIIAASSNYYLNKVWTFDSHNDVAVEYLSFIAISTIGLLLNNAFIYLLHDKKKLNFYVAKFLSIGMVTLWNYLMNFFFTFQ